MIEKWLLLLGLFSAVGLAGVLFWWNRRLRQQLADLHQQQRALTQFKQTLDQSLDCVLLFTANDLRIFYANQGAVDQLGYSPAELGRFTFFDLQPELDEQHLRTLLESHPTEQQRPITVETHYRRKDHQLFPVEVQISAIRSQTACFAAVAHDLSECKQTERALRESESRFRTIFDHAAICISLLNIDGRYLHANQYCLQLFGYSLAELRQKVCLELNHPDFVDLTQKAMQRLLAGEEDYWECNKQFIRQDGSIFWGSHWLAPIRDDNGQCSAFVCIVKDLTASELAEEQVRKLSQAVEQSYSTIVMTNQEGQIEFVNPAFTRTSGYAASEVIGQNPRILKSGKQSDDFYQNMWHVLSQGDVWQGEFCNKRKGGTLYWEHATISPVKNNTGQITHYVAVKEDITTQKEVEAELVRAREAAEAANRAKSAFLANMSHELRTPLNAMLGYAQLLQRDPTLSEEQQQEIATIQRSGEYLLMLINDVLDLAKIEAGRFELWLEPCDLTHLFADLAELFRIRAHQNGLEFYYQARSPLPPFVEADEKRLRQVLMNLLGNAVKFTKKGEIRLEAAYRHGILEVAIIDTGVGIPEQQLSHIFQPFHQLGSIGDKHQGTGLGLSISQSLVTQMEGELQVESVPGEGSRFIVSLPLKSLLKGKQAERSSRRGVAWAKTIAGYDRVDKQLVPYRILIVDDMADNRRILRRFLRSLGFETAEVGSGEEALVVVPDWKPDLILMDVVMPGIDGLETTRRLLAQPNASQPIVIACSANAFAEDRIKSLDAGCQDHISKPVTMARLLDVLSRYLALTWREVDPGVQKADQQITATRLQQLQAMIQHEDIGALFDLLQRLRQQFPDNPILRQLSAQAARFDLKAIRSLLIEKPSS